LDIQNLLELKKALEKVEGDLKTAKHRKETLESMDPETRRASLVVAAEVME
jgi:hypothetical protein